MAYLSNLHRNPIQITGCVYPKYPLHSCKNLLLPQRHVHNSVHKYPVWSTKYWFEVWFLFLLQPIRSITTMTKVFIPINGILMTVLTDRMMFMICCFTPGSSPNPDIWFEPQPILDRKRSSFSTAIAFTTSKIASNKLYNPNAIVSYASLIFLPTTDDISKGKCS